MSEKHSELIAKLVTGHKRDGRCIYSKQGKRELVEACLHPGVSVAGMALRCGVNANLLRKWIQTYEDGRQAGAPLAPAVKPDTARLLPVFQVEEAIAERRGRNALKNAVADHCIEIEVAAFTVRVRGAVDLQQLMGVLNCLAQRR